MLCLRNPRARGRWPRAWAAGLPACIVPLRDLAPDTYRDHFFALLEMERTQCDKDIQVGA